MAFFWEELSQASFKGVPFLLDDSSTSGGRKTAVHEFVNTAHRNVEDLGKEQKTFSIKAWVTGKNPNTGAVSTAQYFSNRDRLIRALDSKGSGILRHPYYGVIPVVSTTYTVVENFREAGIAKFDLNFKKEGRARAPIIRTVSSPGNIGTQADRAYDLIGEELVSAFKTTTTLNFLEAEINYISVGTAFAAAVAIFTQIADQINRFASELRDFQNQVRQLILAPLQAVNSIKGLLTALVDIATTPLFAVQTLESLYDFGRNFPAILLDTAERIERNLNTQKIITIMRAGALTEAYRITSLVPFGNILQLDEFAANLEAQFNAVTPLIVNQNTYTALQQLRNLTVDFLDNQRLTVRQLIDIDAKGLPLQVLLYQQYGNLNDNVTIVDLNQIRDISFTEGTIQILTEKPVI